MIPDVNETITSFLDSFVLMDRIPMCRSTFFIHQTVGLDLDWSNFEFNSSSTHSTNQLIDS